MLKIKSNMGPLDRVLRLVLGAVLIYLSFINSDLIQNHVVRNLLMIIGVLNFSSALISHCPLYIFAGINTRKQSIK